MTNLDEIQARFNKMNDMQKKAVFHTEGPLLILAGAGSGKTTVLVNRIAYIMQAGLAEPWQILEYGQSIGDIYDVVVENMQRQEEGLKG